jgi:hypothetical protein
MVIVPLGAEERRAIAVEAAELVDRVEKALSVASSR